MNIIDIIGTAVGNSLRSRLRTTLTVVAVFIGAFTLTITSAIGTGISSYIDSQVAAFGAADVLSISMAADDEAPAADDGPAPAALAELALTRPEVAVRSIRIRT